MEYVIWAKGPALGPVRLYNKLPVEIKDSENINQFRKKTENIFVWRILYEPENYKRAVQCKSNKIKYNKTSKGPPEQGLYP